ncbi:MAG: hypothetical protein WKF87_12520 [Chryseolinea sp.]
MNVEWRRMIYCRALILTLAAIVLQMATIRLYAQEWPSEVWHEGKIVLLEGDTLNGEIKYDLKQDLIQYNLPNQRTEAFSARKVLFFEIFDNSVRKYRQFFALPYTNTTRYKATVFFELLVEGKLTLLARESIEYKTYSSPYFLGSYSRQVLVNKYFFMDNDGNISAFEGNKGDLLNLMGNKSDDVEKYIKSNRLKTDDKYDFARIVAYYNSI